MNETVVAPPKTDKDPFPRSFWTANTTELFERGAYYAVASFIVLYLGRLGLGEYWPSTLNGLLWSLIYFLPILSGTIADVVGFRRSLILAFVLLAVGYFFMGYPVFVDGRNLLPKAGSDMTADTGIIVPILIGIVLVGLGGAFVKPVISGTVQKTSGVRATMAFGIFYMVINIGSLFGRGIGYFVRTHFSLPYIFLVGVGCSLLALVTVLGFYIDPDHVPGQAVVKKPRKSIVQILADMILVLKNKRFALFLLVSSGFFFLYAQVYNVLPLYLEKVVENDPPVDLYTMANPLVIVAFQLIVTHLFGGMKPIRSIVVGTIIIGLSMAINVIPVLTGHIRLDIMEILPLGSLMITLNVGLVALGELFTSARTYEYIGALAPKGKEGLFLGYASLPMAIGALIGGPAGAAIFNEIMCANSTKDSATGLLNLDPTMATLGWLVLMGIGLLCALSMYLYNGWLRRLGEDV